MDTKNILSVHNYVITELTITLINAIKAVLVHAIFSLTINYVAKVKIFIKLPM